MTYAQPTADGSFAIGGDLLVDRLGYGTMRLTGPGIWGEPADRAGAIKLLRRVVELGVTLIDTADSYGPFVAENLLREALHPYPTGLLIATKGGFTRQGPGQWAPVGRPEYLRQCVEMSLRRLAVDRIDLYQLHRIDPQVPTTDQIGVLSDLRREGKIRHLGLSEVSVAQIEEVRSITTIATVQNMYSLARRQSESVLSYCEDNNLGFIAWAPTATGELAQPGGPLAAPARRNNCTPAQLALAWLLRRSPVMLPIPGTSTMEHLEENLGANQVELTDDEFARLKSILGG
ncbi:MAG: pyridoxine 4-dehydrogenase [Actinomycetota bacterium]|jgi:aryl-alcohol dehydrogenase-like predicted oxidoreductase|nr:pyridoxine 4-dehydrogenase [Actinomycetota bacterium]